jgi:hypothetical protein
MPERASMRRSVLNADLTRVSQWLIFTATTHNQTLMKRIILTIALSLVAAGLFAGDAKSDKQKTACPATGACGETTGCCSQKEMTSTRTQKQMTSITTEKTATCCQGKQAKVKGKVRDTRIAMSPKAAVLAGK